MENTTEALAFALQFFNLQLPRDICNETFDKAKGDIEKLFPLKFSDPERIKDRDEIWEKILTFTNDKDAVLLCKTALLIFSNFDIPYNVLIQQQIQQQRQQKKTPKQYDEQALTIEKVKLRDLLTNMKFYYGKTSDMIKKEIRWREGIISINKKLVPDYQANHNIDGVIQLYRSFFKSTEAAGLNNMPLHVLGAFLSTIHNDQHFKITIAKGKNPSDLPYRALIFVVFIILWEYGKTIKKSARLTAQLMNEYFYHTAMQSDIRKELREEDIIYQWKHSKFCGEFLKSKTPCEILQ